MSDAHRKYLCTSCDSLVRARWGQWGDGYPGYFAVGCDCKTVPVVPQMSQAETPDYWRVKRPDCCRDVDVSELEPCHDTDNPAGYRCPECGATYQWDGAMSTAPDTPEEREPPTDESQQRLGGATDA